MTDQEIRIEMVKACDRTALFGPDFLNDLNATHEAEKHLGNGMHEVFEQHLKSLVLKEELKWICGEKRKIWTVERYVWHATARQRAEAFLRSIGKWKD